MNLLRLTVLLAMLCASVAVAQEPPSPVVLEPGAAALPGEPEIHGPPQAPAERTVADQNRAANEARNRLLGKYGERARNLAVQADPRKLGTQIKTNYRDGRFYATDYSEHRTIGSAIQGSIRPTNIRANVAASVRNNMSPISMVGALIGPASMEVSRQLSEDGRISPTKLVKAFEPGAIAGGLAAGFAGDAMGAMAQSALARTMGPVGPVAGFLVRPIISYSFFLVGAKFGGRAQHGDFSLKNAFADSMRTVDPARDTGALIGGSIGAVVGQAIIPIPVVGSIAGGMVGGVIGTAIGNWIGKKGLTGKANKGAKGWLSKMADKLEGKNKKKSEEQDAPPSVGPAAATTAGDHLLERLDSDELARRPVERSGQQARARTGEIDLNESIEADLIRRKRQ